MYVCVRDGTMWICDIYENIKSFLCVADAINFWAAHKQFPQKARPHPNTLMFLKWLAWEIPIQMPVFFPVMYLYRGYAREIERKSDPVTSMCKRIDQCVYGYSMHTSNYRYPSAVYSDTDMLYTGRVPYVSTGITESMAALILDWDWITLTEDVSTPSELGGAVPLEWDVSYVANTRRMFSNYQFNGRITAWDVPEPFERDLFEPILEPPQKFKRKRRQQKPKYQNNRKHFRSRSSIRRY